MKKQKNKTILGKVVQFIKYHNAFTIGLVLVFVFSGAVFASETVRDNIIGEKIVETQGVDNNALLSADLDNFDFSVQITDVSEDEEKYYVDYQYQTFAAKDNVWQKVDKAATLKVFKQVIRGKDLGLYVSEEFGEIVDSQIAYLKDVQEKERQKGETFVQETIKYTALIGLVLNPKTRELPGYEPVVKSPEVVVYEEPDQEMQPLAEATQPQEGAQGPTGFNIDTLGITMYDEETGEPYCIKMKAGAMVSLAGKCSEFTETTSTTAVDSDTQLFGNTEVPLVGSASTTITSYPETEGESVVAVFTFVSPQKNITFQCQIDHGEFSACQSPRSYSNLTREQHVFNVRSVTQEGIGEEVSASFIWTIIPSISSGQAEPVAEEPEATSTEPIFEPEPEIPSEPEETATTSDEIATTTEEVATSTEPAPESEATSTEPISEPEPEPEPEPEEPTEPPTEQPPPE